MNKGKIYIIRNKITDMVYVGQTNRTLCERFKEHINPRIWSHGNKLHTAMHELGTNNFYIELLEDNIPESELDDRERYWIAEYNSYKNGYNSTMGGQLGEGMIYVSEKMLKDWGIYEAWHELKSIPDSESRSAELQYFIADKLADVFPDFADYYENIKTKMACARAGVKCEFV